jgi:hypothetical protein
VLNNDRKIGLIEENAHGLQYAPGNTRMPNGVKRHPIQTAATSGQRALAAIQELLRRFRIGQKGCGNGPTSGSETKSLTQKGSPTKATSCKQHGCYTLQSDGPRLPLTLTGRPFARVNDERGGRARRKNDLGRPGYSLPASKPVAPNFARDESTCRFWIIVQSSRRR